MSKKRLAPALATPSKSLVLPENFLDNSKLTFSFQYFDQRDYFGFGDCKPSWFSALLQRLSDLSGKKHEILTNRLEKESYRLHHIDWTKTNCPLKRSDFSNVPKPIRENEDEFPFWQFELSMGNGRVVGFFKHEPFVFYVLLLDPQHNMQPAAAYDYSVDKTTIAMTDYEIVNSRLHFIEIRRSKCSHLNSCPIPESAEMINQNSIYVPIHRDLIEVYQRHLPSASFSDIFEEFLISKL